MEGNTTGPENLPFNDRTTDEPWQLNDREIKEGLFKTASRYPDMDFPLAALKQTFQLKRIFKPRRFDWEGNMLFEEDPLLKLINSTFDNLPDSARKPLMVWILAAQVQGGFLRPLLENVEIVKAQYSDVRDHLEKRFGDTIYLWRGTGWNIDERKKYSKSSRQPFISCSALWRVAQTFENPVRLYAMPVNNIVAVVDADTRHGLLTAEFIVDIRDTTPQPVATLDESLVKALKEVDMADFLKWESYIKSRSVKAEKEPKPIPTSQSRRGLLGRILGQKSK